MVLASPGSRIIGSHASGMGGFFSIRIHGFLTNKSDAGLPVAEIISFATTVATRTSPNKSRKSVSLPRHPKAIRGPGSI